MREETTAELILALDRGLTEPGVSLTWPRPVPAIVLRNSVDLAAVATAAHIWHSAATVWWTHDPADLAEARNAAGRAPGDLPCDPLASPLYQTDDVAGWLAGAVAHAANYGPFGIVAFWAAHAQNCRRAATDAPATVRTWPEITALLEGQGGRLLPAGPVDPAPPARGDTLGVETPRPAPLSAAAPRDPAGMHRAAPRLSRAARARARAARKRDAS